MNRWLRASCWLYNHALAQRSKAYKRRKESISFYQQCAWLTNLRRRIPALQECPRKFLQDALRRVDLAFKAFFRRVRAGEKPGYPRFQSSRRYNSTECLREYKYIRKNRVHVPAIGLVKMRIGQQEFPEIQKSLRIIRRTDGWYGNVVFARLQTSTVPVRDSVGIDVGLSSFAAFSTGEKIENPRWKKRSERKLRSLQRRMSRKTKRSRNHKKAARRLARLHQRVAFQRRSFAHQLSRRIVNDYGLIAVEKLNIKGMSSGRLAKSITDAAWGQFLRYLSYKAECAGRQLIEVNPCYTSQTCPRCGTVKKKLLSERIHECPCGCHGDRDVIAAQVILARALESSRGVTPVEESVAVAGVKPRIKSIRRSRKDRLSTTLTWKDLGGAVVCEATLQSVV